MRRFYISFAKMRVSGQMRAATMIFALALTHVAAQPAIAEPTKIHDSDALLARISLSFSAIPFGAQLKDVEMPLAEIRYSNCRKDGPCWVENADRVRNIFDGAEQRLSGKLIKWINDGGFSGKPISALNIGLARKKEEVAQKISLFLGEAKYECVKVSDMTGYLATIYPEESVCTWKVQNADVSAKFYDYPKDGKILGELSFKRSAQ